MNCPKCGREDGHWLGCNRIPKAEAPAPDPADSVCDEPQCEEPRKGIKYCAEHSTDKARNARAYLKRKEAVDE